MQAPPQLERSWQEELSEEWEKPYMDKLAHFLKEERLLTIPIYPSKREVFSAFELTPFDQVQVVIMGQDPYHGVNQAHGLSFSVKPGVALPPSLKNIFKELKEDLGIDPPNHGCLTAWAEQGVLLLNAVLTVRAQAPGSHANKGWEIFTDRVVERLASREDPVIFVLWGKSAQEKCRTILSQTPPQISKRHFILTAAHPSPYSAHSGFFGCRHFSKINALLESQGKRPINWKIV